MNTKEILLAQARTYLQLAKTLKQNNVVSWKVYAQKAKQVCEQIKKDETKEINMNDFLAATA